MAGPFTLRAETAQAELALRRMQEAVKDQYIDAPVSKAAWITHERMVKMTPRRWTGTTAQSWKVIHNQPGRYTVTNTSKVMIFLEVGTQAHGPVTAKRLFIPLNAKAARAGPRGVMHANRRANIRAAFGVGSKRGRTQPYTYGVDYVLAKWVRGIKAMRIVRNHRDFASATLRSAIRLQIRKTLANR